MKMCTRFVSVVILLALSVLVSADEADAPSKPLVREPDSQSSEDIGGAAAALSRVEDLISLSTARKRVESTANKLGESFSLDGEGLAVVVIDSGIRADHIDFEGDGKIPVQLNLIGGVRDIAADDLGHGTHIAGIIAANGIHRGIAPAAKIIPIKVLDNRGKLASVQTLEKALIWVIDNFKERDISVVNLSIAFPIIESNDDYKLGSNKAKIQLRIKELRARGVAVVCAAGNEFQNYNDAKGRKFLEEGMGFPAIVRETISVGAVYGKTYATGGMIHEHYRGIKSYTIVKDQIAPFSNRLNEYENRYCCTDVFAPGGGLIISTGHKSSQAESEYKFGGTSQATAVVSGVVLLLQQYYQDASSKNGVKGDLPPVNQVEQWIRQGVIIKDGDDEFDEVRHTCGTFVRVDVSEAIRACQKDIIKSVEGSK